MGISNTMNAIIKTCPHTKKKTSMRIMSKMKVGGMKGKSELTIQPDYLSKEICDSLSANIRNSKYLCQIIAKGKNYDMHPGWLEPRIMMLCQSISCLLPVEDRECCAAAKLAIEYANYWRPVKTQGILLCESHKFTPKEVVLGGPQLRPNLLPQYDGPRGSLFHVSNLYYGLNKCGTSSLPCNVVQVHFRVIRAKEQGI